MPRINVLPLRQICNAKDPFSGRWDFGNPNGEVPDGLPPGSTIHTLWIGNSLTNTPVDFNDYSQGPLPARIAPMLAEFGITLTYASRIQGGAEFATHAANAATMADISSGSYDFVNLQGYYTGFSSASAYLAAAQPLYEAAGAAGAKVLFEGLWPYLGDPGSPQHPAAANAVEGAADAVPYAFAVQVGRAWARVLEVDPVLHAKLRSDSTHQSAAGEYLNALAYTRFFTAQSVASVVSISGPAAAALSAGERTTIKAAVDHALTRFYNPAAGVVPVITVSAPVEGHVYAPGSTVTFSAAATAGGADISNQIQWSQGGQVVHTGATFTAVPGIGRYTVTASVMANGSTVSATREYRVLDSGAANTAPTTYAKAQTIPWNNSFVQINLAANAQDLETDVDWSTLQLDLAGFSGVSAAQNSTDAATIDVDYSNEFTGPDQILWRVADTAGLYSGWTAINVTVSNPGLLRTFGYVGTNALPSPAAPALGQSVALAEYNSTLRTASDIEAYAGTDPMLVAADNMRHDYSRKQAWSAGGAYIYLLSSNGWTVIVDAVTLQIVRRLYWTNRPYPAPGGRCQHHWNPVVEGKFRYSGAYGTRQYYEYDIATDTGTILFDLTNVTSVRGNTAITSLNAIPGFEQAHQVWWDDEGECSASGDEYFLMVETAAGTLLGFISVRVSTQEIMDYLLPGDVVQVYDSGSVTSWTVPLPAVMAPNNVATSPSGKFGLIGNYGNTTTGGTMAVKLTDMKKGIKLHNHHEHADCGVSREGHDQYLSVTFHADEVLYPSSQFGGPCDGRLITTVFDLDSNGDPYVIRRDVLHHLNSYGTGTDRVPTVSHISGRAFNKPGWFVFSTYGSTTGGSGWANKKIMVIEPVNNGEVRQLGPSFVAVDGYFAETQASPNRDLTKVIFASDWGGTKGIDAYLYELPTDSLRDL